MHIDRTYSQHKATQMLRGKHSTRPLKENALVKEVEEGLNNFRVRKTNLILNYFLF